MHARAKKRYRSAFVLPTLLGLCCALSGCKSENLQGDKFTDDYATWGESHRPADTSDGNLYGASDKARQVERNLGVR
jgi:hypothetical protein